MLNLDDYQFAIESTNQERLEKIYLRARRILGRDPEPTNYNSKKEENHLERSPMTISSQRRLFRSDSDSSSHLRVKKGGEDTLLSK